MSEYECRFRGMIVSGIWDSDLTEQSPRGLMLFARCGFGANDWNDFTLRLCNTLATTGCVVLER